MKPKVRASLGLQAKGRTNECQCYWMFHSLLADPQTKLTTRGLRVLWTANTAIVYSSISCALPLRAAQGRLEHHSKKTTTLECLWSRGVRGKSELTTAKLSHKDMLEVVVPYPGRYPLIYYNVNVLLDNRSGVGRLDFFRCFLHTVGYWWPSYVFFFFVVVDLMIAREEQGNSECTVLK